MQSGQFKDKRDSLEGLYITQNQERLVRPEVKPPKAIIRIMAMAPDGTKKLSAVNAPLVQRTQAPMMRNTSFCSHSVKRLHFWLPQCP